MYRIYADGVCIYNDVYSLDNMKVISPKLTMEDNAAGSLSMTLPPSNVGYQTITPLATDISVTKDGEVVWEGRVLSESKDFWNSRTLLCEGELAFFNDSTQPAAEYSSLTVRGFLETLLQIHNSKVKANRRFTLGAVTVHDANGSLDWYTNNEKTIECINEKLIKQFGGHLRIRRVNGVRYLDYLAEYPTTTSQVIQFGKNLLDFTRKWDWSEFATVILPLGSRLDTSPFESLDAYLTIESENNGSPYLQSTEAVNTYGWIEKVVSWDDVTTAAALLKKAREYLSDLQFDNMDIELSALDLHYLDVQVEAVHLLDEIRVISRPHGMDRLFPVRKLEIPLNSPEKTQFTLGDNVKTSLTSVNNLTNAKILQKIERLPKAHTILKEAKENATAIMNMATTGYITITKDDYGSDTLYISNIRDYKKADKLWKWNMNGLGYSKDGGKTFGLAITMDGAIVADFITTGVLNADVIRIGVLKDYAENVVFDLNKGSLTMKKGSIYIGNDGKGNTNFSVDTEGNLYARRGTFAGTLVAAQGTFAGELQAVTGDFKGIVQAEDFLDRNGNSMMDGMKFDADYLDLYGLTIRKKGTNTITFRIDENGNVTINGNITMGAGSTINWETVENTNLDSNPAYSKALDAISAANDAYDRADDAYKLADSVELPSYIKSTYIGSTTIRSPVIEGGEFYGSEFNVIAEDDYGSFDMYAEFGRHRYHMFTIDYSAGDAPYVNIYSPANAYLEFGKDSNSMIYFNGTVDFSKATITGIT